MVKYRKDDCMNVVEQRLIKCALEAKKKAYNPYSNFSVGAAVYTRDGNIYQGCNIENASFSLTICAERTALFHAYTANDRKIKKMVVVGDTDKPISPCGSCRQVLYELCPPDMEVILVGNNQVTKTMTVEQLLPYGFDAIQ